MFSRGSQNRAILRTAAKLVKTRRTATKVPVQPLWE